MGWAVTRVPHRRRAHAPKLAFEPARWQRSLDRVRAANIADRPLAVDEVDAQHVREMPIRGASRPAAGIPRGSARASLPRRRSGSPNTASGRGASPRLRPIGHGRGRVARGTEAQDDAFDDHGEDRVADRSVDDLEHGRGCARRTARIGAIGVDDLRTTRPEIPPRAGALLGNRSAAGACRTAFPDRF